MNDIIRIGVDTSKRVFQLHGVDATEQPVLRKKSGKANITATAGEVKKQIPVTVTLYTTLKITPENYVYCFEVNPSPAFSYYESQTGQPISCAVADYLSGN